MHLHVHTLVGLYSVVRVETSKSIVQSLTRFVMFYGTWKKVKAAQMRELVTETKALAR